MRDAAMTDTLTALAREAGAAIMAVRAGADLGVAAKADASPVTAADLAADAVIAAGLRAAWPGLAAVSEERPDSWAATGTYFLVDPLDGTREFVRRDGAFTVNIALIEDGAPTAGVVYAPALGRLWRTLPDGGAQELRDGVDAPRPLRARAAPPGDLCAVASHSHLDDRTRAYLAQIAPARVTQTGSSLKFCLLAAGEADVYPRFGPTMHWDTAAADAVLRAAGGRVLALPAMTPLRYLGADRRNPWFLAAGADAPPAPDPALLADAP